MVWASILCAVTLLPPRAGAFYVPGVAPVEFADGEDVKVYAVKMTSVITQLPYDYYSLPFCGQATSECFDSRLARLIDSQHFFIISLLLLLCCEGKISALQQSDKISSFPTLPPLPHISYKILQLEDDFLNLFRCRIFLVTNRRLSFPKSNVRHSFCR